MRLNKPEYRHLPKWIWAFAAVLAARITLYSYPLSHIVYVDSFSYINYNFSDMLNFNFSNPRTPIYPLIINICRTFFGENIYLYAVVALQCIVSLIAVVFSYKICEKFIKSQVLSSLITFLFGITPAINCWNMIILTESFALSGTVIFIWMILSYIEKPSAKYGILCMALMLVLTFLRPSFLVFDVILAVFWIFRFLLYKQERKTLIKLIVSSVVMFGVIFGYCAVFQNYHGIFSISDPVPRQKMFICTERKYYENSSNDEFKKLALEEAENYQNMENPPYAQSYYITYKLIFKYGNEQVENWANECIKDNKSAFYNDTISAMSSLAENRFGEYSDFKEPETEFEAIWLNAIVKIRDFFNFISLGHIYIFIIAELLVCIVLWILKRDVPWIHLGLFGFTFAITASTFLSTNAEYPRTMICGLPFFYTGIAVFVRFINSKFKTSGKR